MKAEGRGAGSLGLDGGWSDEGGEERDVVVGG